MRFLSLSQNENKNENFKEKRIQQGWKSDENDEITQHDTVQIKIQTGREAVDSSITAGWTDRNVEISQHRAAV